MVLVSYFFEKCFLFSTKSLEKVWKSNFRYLIRWFFKLQIHQVKPGMKSSLFTFSLAKILALSFQTEWVNCHHRLSGGSWSRSGPNCVLWIVNPYYEEDLHFSKSSSDMGKWKNGMIYASRFWNDVFLPNDPKRKQDMPEAVVCRRENDLTEKVNSWNMEQRGKGM